MRREPAVTCKRTWESDSGNRRDFQIWCPLCAAAVRSCCVLEDVIRLNNALQGGDVSQDWLVWSHAAETGLVDAHRLAGGPEPDRGVKLGRGAARFSVVRLGGPKMRSARARCAGPGYGAQVDLYGDNRKALD